MSNLSNRDVFKSGDLTGELACHILQQVMLNGEHATDHTHTQKGKKKEKKKEKEKYKKFITVLSNITFQ